MTPLQPTPFRRGVDWLLATHPGFDLLDATMPGRSVGEPAAWLIVELGQPSEGELWAHAVHRYAIWKNTGAVHTFDGSAVSDEPVHVPGRSCGHNGWVRGCPQCEAEHAYATALIEDAE